MLGDTILSTVSMPLINPNSNVSNTFSTQTQQQQIANMMMANLINEQARLFHQYSVSSAAMNYLTNSSPASLPASPLTTAQTFPNCNRQMSDSTQSDVSLKPKLGNESALGPLKLSDLLNQKPGLDISLKSNDLEANKEEGAISSMIGQSTKELNPKNDK